MPSLNKVFLAGNLTRDPELRYTPGGTAVVQFGMAVNRRFRNREGTMQEEATFVDIEAWGRQAESANEYLSKGSPVLIEGRLKLDSWESKQTGERRSKLRVVGERVQFLGSRGRGGGRGRDADGERPSRRRSRPPSGRGDGARRYGGPRDGPSRASGSNDADEPPAGGSQPGESQPGESQPGESQAGGSQDDGLPPDNEIPF